MKQTILIYRGALLLTLVAVTPLGFATKFYPGVWGDWLRDYAGDVLYEIFWVVLACLIWTRTQPKMAAIVVFLATSILEFLQLWQPPFLQTFRTTFVGRTLIGTTFVWADFLYYILGCILAWLCVRYLKNKILHSK